MTRGSCYITLLPDPVGRKAKTYFRMTNALIAFLCSSFKMNSLSMSKWTRIYKFQLSSGSHVCCKRIQTKRLFVTWLVTLLLIICPSSYKARLNNFIGTADIEPQIISTQWSNARPNFPTKNIVGGAKFGLVSRLLYNSIFL